MEENFLCEVEGRLGYGPQDLREVKLLNRIVRWTPTGLRYEADPRRAEQLLRDLLSAEVSGVKPISFPGYRREAAEEEAAEPLSPAACSSFRALAARANYSGVARPDLAFSAKECCRRTSAPMSADWAALVGLARYLTQRPRCAYRFPWQDEGVAIRAYVDTDFA
eukprot:10522772-Alexandrium_andersonii.AAC.1